ncbi:MAG: PorP/SprF family type IX secretion system membrane protein [Saprospiraceae bacterium]|nr:PorP/SprF family type IX secretion system membrane protein [Saprospiraceae bacterium]
MKKISILILALTMSFASNAQDIHFSQFYMAPLNLNPAMTGVMNCKQRLSANYRNQWASVLRDKAFQTYQVAYDTKIPVGRYDYIGVGGSLWGDKAGSLNFRTNQLSLDFAYSKRMGGYRKKASYLVMGAELGLAQRGLNTLDARWGSQNNNGVFDPTLPSNENVFTRDNFMFADVSAGLLWFSVLDDNTNFYIGGAYDHINRANQSFTKDKFVPLFSKFTIHAGGEVGMTDRVSFVPGIVTFLQGPYLQVNGGTSMRFILGSSKRSTEAIQFGVWTRLANKDEGGMLMDALILSTRFEYSQFTIGFSYDQNVSSLKSASRGNGGFEFSLQYKICGNERRNVFCPNF